MAEWSLTGNDVFFDETGKLVKKSVVEKKNYQDPYVLLARDLQDISQSHHFKVTLSKLKLELPSAAFGNFLPVKNISYNEITWDNLSLPVGIFGNFPLMHRRQVGTINLTMYDKDNDHIEKQIRAWEAECFPKGKYVSYLSEICSEFTYSSYTVTGKLNKTITLYVVPTGSYTISRSYEENNAKLLQLSLTVVGFRGNVTEGLVSSGEFDESLRSPSYYPEGF